MLKIKTAYSSFLILLISFSSLFSQNITEISDDSLNIKNLPLLYEETTEQHNIYSTSHIFADKISQTTSLSFFDALKGRLSGYYNYIRGTSSVNQGPVMFLVDGFEQGYEYINNLDVDEIESVSVLKDAASTALYGQRAANGIILINTKRGFIGKPEIKIEGTYGLYGITEKPEFYSSYDYTGFYNEALQNDNLAPRFTEPQRQLYKDGKSEFYPNTDWYKEALRDLAPLSKVGINVSGGNPNVKYFVFANYTNSQGIYSNTELNDDYSNQEKKDRINLRSNFDIQVFKNTSIKADVGGYIYELNTPRSSNWEIFNSIQKTPPIIQSMYDDGMFGGDATYRDNPVALIAGRGYSKMHYRALNGSFKLTQNLYDIIEGLRFHGHVNFFNWAYYRDNWTKDYLVENRTEYDVSRYGFEGTLSYGTSLSQLRNAGTELYFDYQKNWGDSNITGLLGFRLSKETASGQNQINSHIGTFGKISYSNQNKYFADLVMGYNGSQNFAPEKRFGFFPALALGWLLSEEDFLKNSNSIKTLKLRASAGLTGSDYVSSAYRFMYFQSYIWSGGYFLRNDNAWASGIIEGMPAFKNAKWESSFKTNFGVDLELKNNLRVGIDLYMDNRYDILVTRAGTVPDFVGIDLPLDNKGKVRNYGVETTVDYQLTAGAFKFNLGGYFNYNKSKIIEMNEIPQPHKYLERTGLPVGQYFGLETIGFFRDQTDINNSPKQLFSEVKPGDIKYKDQNNDGVIDEFDVVAIGRSNMPEIIYAVTPSISFKGLTLEAVFEGVANRSIYLNTSQFWGFYDQRNLASNAVEGRWTSTGAENATLPRLTTIDNNNNYRLNDLWLVNGNFLKLRLVELKYDLPKSIINQARMSNVQLFFRASNLLSVDNIKNADPENLGPEPTFGLKNIGIKITF